MHRQIFFTNTQACGADSLLMLIFTNCCLLQEPTSEKTNNGIHYKLQLLYSNGEFKCHILQTRASMSNISLNVCIKKNLIIIMASQNIIKINLLFWLIITELFMFTRYLTFFVGLFVFVFIAYNSSKLTSVLGFLSPGVRTEQDLYIRLIDSMTKQVSCCYTSVSTHGATQCSHPWSPCAKP